MSNGTAEIDISAANEAKRSRLLSLIEEWLDTLDKAISARDGKVMCESTRMLMGYGELLHAFFPGSWQVKTARRTLNLFEAAVKTVGQTQTPEEEKEEWKLYRRNVQERERDLVVAMRDWCPQAIAA